MKRKTRRTPGIIGISLLLAILMVAGATFASASGVSILSNTPPMESVHEKLDISEITGEIVEPPQLTSAASAIAAEKAWYEYVYYSSEPVAYYYLNDNTRISFYDPYDYASSLVMEVDDSLTDWSSNNSMQISYTTGNSLTDTSGKSIETVSTTHYGYSDTTTTTTGPSTVTTTVNNRTDSYNTSKTETTIDNSGQWTASETIHLGTEMVFESETQVEHTFGTGKTTTEIISTDEKGRSGYTESEDTTTVEDSGSEKTVTSTIADRTCVATGYTVNSEIAFSTNNSTTITKTYDAAYFNASGSPLQWKIVKYTVKMPMRYQIEYLIEDEWIFGDYNYCLLTTIQGTSRAWLQNNVAYYEHWGTGEPVTWDGFWAQFFTEDSLIAAYKNRLYPDY